MWVSEETIHHHYKSCYPNITSLKQDMMINKTKKDLKKGFLFTGYFRYLI